MENQDFNTGISVEQSPEKIFNAITNVRGWWSENIEGKTDELNSEFTHRDRYLLVTFKITYLTPQKMVWKVKNSHCNKFRENIHEWAGTKVLIEIIPKGQRTEIRFTHQGLVPQFECYQACSKAWTYFITDSLKKLIKTGKGDPISKDYASFTSSIVVSKSPQEVFESINNVRGWWLDTIEGDTDKPNSEFKFYVRERLQFHFKIIEMVPYEKVVWQVLEQNFEDTDQQEWAGTTVLFEILEDEKQTRLRFTHLGLVPSLECYETCQNAWTNYIHISLFNFIKDGNGEPNKW